MPALCHRPLTPFLLATALAVSAATLVAQTRAAARAVRAGRRAGEDLDEPVSGVREV